MSFVRIVDFSNIKNLYISNKPLKTPAHHYFDATAFNLLILWTSAIPISILPFSCLNKLKDTLDNATTMTKRTLPGYSKTQAKVRSTIHRE